MFAGTLRDNLDPLKRFTDKQLWDCLEMVYLREDVKHHYRGLECVLTAGCLTLTAGQKRLFSLARILLRKKKVLIVEDGPQLDSHVDEKVEDVIKSYFSDCTVLRITGHIQFAMMCEKVLILNDGKVVEFDSPQKLINDKTSLFYALSVDIPSES